MKALFLYNPNSGKGKIKKKLPYIEKRLKARYDAVDIVTTKSAEELEALVRAGAEEYDAIIFSGGDGTFNNVLSGLGDRRVQLGYLPSGTMNDVARSLKIPRSVKGALNVILKGRSQLLDSMKIGNRNAMYIVAAGAFTSATYSTPQTKKRAFGALAYAAEVLRHHMKYRVFPLKVTADGKTVETSAVLIFILNGRSVAGFPVNKNGSMCDGMLEVAILKQAGKPNLFRRIGVLFTLVFLFLFGLRMHKKNIITLRGREVTVEADDSVVWDYDGEEGKSGTVTVENRPESVCLFVPKKGKV